MKNFFFFKLLKFTDNGWARNIHQKKRKKVFFWLMKKTIINQAVWNFFLKFFHCWNENVIPGTILIRSYQLQKNVTFLDHNMKIHCFLLKKKNSILLRHLHAKFQNDEMYWKKFYTKYKLCKRKYLYISNYKQQFWISDYH